MAAVSHRDLHVATFPDALPSLCILAGSKEGDLIVDPFAGRGTTLIVARELNRQFIGFDINPSYVKAANKYLTATLTQSS